MTDNNFDIVIIGSGYRALVSAYLALKKNKKVLIISKTKNLLGIMSPLSWQGGKFDKGYQFFDGLNEHTKNFLNDFVGKEVLHDFGYGSATITNNKLYPYHASAYWPHEGKFFCLKVFIKHLLNFKRNINAYIDKAESYNDLLNLLPKEIKEIITKECERRIGLKPGELSFSAQNSPRFQFRQAILPDNISTFLKKKFKYFEYTLASRRKSIGLECISLYPKGKNLGFAGEIMEKKVLEKGAKIISLDGLKIYNDDLGMVKIVSQGSSIKTKKIYIVTELDDALNFFEKKITDKSSIYYLPQIFYFFSINKINSEFQYVMGNNIGGLINRANNMSLYGEKTSNNEFVISAEVADNKDKLLWNDPESYTEKVWREIQLMGLANKNQNFIRHDIFPIKKTTPLELVSFNKVLKELKIYTKNNFSNKVVFPGLGIPFSRVIFLKEVERQMNLDE